jgi:hypothetical protein
MIHTIAHATNKPTKVNVGSLGDAPAMMHTAPAMMIAIKGRNTYNLYS